MEGSEERKGRRFASLAGLAVRAGRTFERFPLVVLSAVGAAAVLHRLADIDFEATAGAEAFYPVLMVLVLGIPLFFSIQMLIESRGWSGWTAVLATAVGPLAAFAYYWLIPYPIRGADIFRYFQLLAGLHLAAAFVPFAGRANAENAFWQYNKGLLLRFALAALYSAVLYVGLALAIAACQTLLDIELDDEVYAQLWFWVAFAYNTWFFLAGVPKDVAALGESRDYPTGLRVFTQYVLIPLVVVYLIILYAYTAKIIIEWDLPKGWVGYPVIGVAVTGMLALLLVHPIRGRAENAWIATYAKYFHWSLFPLVALIAVAIGTRIGHYGITERRYAVVVLTAWLFAITLYFTLRKRQDIRVVPVSLCAVVFATAFGPWGATSVSRHSQLARLREILIQEEVMADGRIDATPKDIEFERQKEISNVVRYLYDFHGLSEVRSWYAQADRLPRELPYEMAMQEMGLEYISPRTQRPTGFAIEAGVPSPLPVAGYDYVYRLDESWSDEPSRFRVRLDSLTELRLDGTLLQIGPPTIPSARLSGDLRPLIEELRDRQARGQAYGPDANVLRLRDERYELLMYLASAGGAGAGDSLKLDRLSATFLLKVAKPR